MTGTSDATVVVASLAVGTLGAGIAIGASIAENTITADAGAVAGITNSRISDIDQLKVDAQTTQTLTTVVFAGAVEAVGSGVSEAGGGSDADNDTHAPPKD